jgi:hypothetical protein
MTVIQISSDVLHNVLTSKLSIALTGTIRPEYIETVAEDIAASIIELATAVEPAPVHTYESCSHCLDYASQAEHDRDCPAAVDWVQPKEI